MRHLHRDPFKGTCGPALADAVSCTDLTFDAAVSRTSARIRHRRSVTAPRSSPAPRPSHVARRGGGGEGGALRHRRCRHAPPAGPSTRPAQTLLPFRRLSRAAWSDLMYDDLAWQPMTEDQRSGSSIAHRHHLGSCIDDRRSDWGRRSAGDCRQEGRGRPRNRALLLVAGTGESSCTAIYSPSARGQRARVEISMRARFRRWKVESAPPAAGGWPSCSPGSSKRRASETTQPCEQLLINFATTYATKFGSCRRAPVTTSGLGR